MMRGDRLRANCPQGISPHHADAGPALKIGGGWKISIAQLSGGDIALPAFVIGVLRITP
jgi:hypothetical protein